MNKYTLALLSTPIASLPSVCAATFVAASVSVVTCPAGVILRIALRNDDAAQGLYELVRAMVRHE
ncbi:hypothetical protein [Paraburkholderia caribensis]|uniref:hypothetical protein n=1 Tax=Paraburkholderia caribensis TaxID=75105 RepID=UPI0034D2E0FB